MKCDVCGKTTNINYGDSNSVVCDECYGTDKALKKIEESKESSKSKSKSTFDLYELKEKPFLIIGKVFEYLGYFIVLIGIIFFISWLDKVESFIAGAFINGINIAIVGLFFIAVGYLIPYIVSIEKNTKETNEILRIERNK